MGERDKKIVSAGGKERVKERRGEERRKNEKEEVEEKEEKQEKKIGRKIDVEGRRIISNRG